MFLARFPDSVAARFVVGRHIQTLHRCVGLVDRLVHLALVQESKLFKSTSAPPEKPHHWADFVSESAGLFAGEASLFHGKTVF